jgi:hypothetical protein
MPLKLSGEEWASHMAKNLANLHASCVEECGRDAADRLVRLALDAAERKTWELIDAVSALGCDRALSGCAV